MLIILGGLPGVGKTSVARLAARKLGAIHLRIDTIEQAVLDCGVVPTDDMGPVGYVVANRVAMDNLRLGNLVIGDSVNPIEISRAAWREAANIADKPFVQIELICSDRDQHRHRVETRQGDIENLKLPDWQKVCDREYHPWPDADLVIDTALQSLDVSSDILVRFVRDRIASI
ncbi:AAA family ATPase [Thalassospira sp. HF15]|uniref:AAA family ATPase n=1 Tax=Thalassospira sp. HF15 TaxID=2722755 RepID=UPI001430D67F|nr:AAA family ATPase [Thalassospira sp. HF15]NIY74598.1 AAA family ATPase [Thalassospira sp. HF15]